MIKDLVRRKVPQILGIYLAVGWGVLEFTDWLVNRYVLSSHLIDLGLVTWASMIPTVLMLAYFHGAPGPDGWTRTERIGIPLNLLAAAAIVAVMFGGKDLGAATTSVTVEDETGQMVERLVPKTEFRKRLALFYFQNQSGDTALDWLQYGIALALQDDLLQDIFLDVRTSLQFNERLEESGHPDGLGLPLALRRDIAEESHLEYFVSGEIDGSTEEVSVTLRLHDVKRGKLLHERTFAGSDMFEIVDRMSLQLKRDLGIPEQHIEESRDLPISEVLTRSVTAYRQFVEGWRAWELEDWQGAAAGFAAAAEEDPEYAYANALLFRAYAVVNETERAYVALEAAMEHAYKLPERYQFGMRVQYYRFVKQDYEKARAVAGMHAELFPDDISAHTNLLTLHLQGGERPEAITAAQRILELDPGSANMLLLIGTQYQLMAEFEEAAHYFEQYAEQYPQDPRGFNELGDLSRTLGEHERALEHYERAHLLDPGDVAALIDIGRTELALGHFARALAQMNEALESAATPLQRSQAYRALRDLYQLRGTMSRALDYMHASWAELAKAAPPLGVVQEKLRQLETYVKADRTNLANATIDEIEEELDPPFDLLVGIGRLVVAIELADADAIEPALEEMDRFMTTLGVEAFRPFYVFGRGRMLELRGRCEQAIIAYERALALEPTEAEIHTHIGRCQRKLGDYDAAIERIQGTLRIQPFSPEAHYELALVYSAAGDGEKALEHLQTALGVWEDADPQFKPAREAREKLAELSGAV